MLALEAQVLGVAEHEPRAGDIFADDGSILDGVFVLDMNKNTVTLDDKSAGLEVAKVLSGAVLVSHYVITGRKNKVKIVDQARDNGQHKGLWKAFFRCFNPY